MRFRGDKDSTDRPFTQIATETNAQLPQITAKPSAQFTLVMLNFRAQILLFALT